MSDSKPGSTYLPIVIPLIVIVLGLAWLLTSLAVLPEVDWAFVLLLGLSGLLLLVIRPLLRGRLVAGLIMLSVAIGEMFQDMQMVSRDIEVPVLVILGGLFALVAHFLPLDPPPPAEEVGGDEAEKPADEPLKDS